MGPLKTMCAWQVFLLPVGASGPIPTRCADQLRRRVGRRFETTGLMRLVEAKKRARDWRENPWIFEPKTAPGHSLDLHEADHPIPGEPRPLQPRVGPLFRNPQLCLQKKRVGGSGRWPQLPQRSLSRLQSEAAYSTTGPHFFTNFVGTR